MERSREARASPTRTGELGPSPTSFRLQGRRVRREGCAGTQKAPAPFPSSDTKPHYSRAPCPHSAGRSLHLTALFRHTAPSLFQNKTELDRRKLLWMNRPCSPSVKRAGSGHGALFAPDTSGPSDNRPRAQGHGAAETNAATTERHLPGWSAAGAARSKS